MKVAYFQKFLKQKCCLIFDLIYFWLWSAPSGGFAKKIHRNFWIFFFWLHQFWSKILKISSFVLGKAIQSYINVQLGVKACNFAALSSARLYSASFEISAHICVEPAAQEICKTFKILYCTSNNCYFILWSGKKLSFFDRQ